MRSLRICLKRITVLMALTLAAVLPTHAQAAPPSMEGKTAEQFYKSIKVLNGVPADQVIESMHQIRAALGVNCEFCHEDPDRAADTKEAKETARQMMRMVMDINKNNFKGQQEVTCYSCHRGSTVPMTTVPLPAVEKGEEPEPQGLPSADQILSKYVQALGGEQAIRKITSRIITGTQFIPTGPGGTMPVPAVIERSQKAPNLVVNFYRTPTYTISDGFDGSKAWSQDLRGRVTEPGATDQMRAKRNADFYLPLDLKQTYTQMQVRGFENVNGHDAYAVIARPQGDRVERLYFDVQTGLLVRKWSSLATPVGEAPFQVDYEDYRDTGSGVKFPYLIVMNPANARTEPSTTATIRVTKVQDNAPLDSSKFTKPESKAAAAAQ
ncbi:MAG: c-type cytochrome [Acidobacteria bacterium]|nr:MAG: c-type cytochrome [Acidobacteriota bacterium]